MSLPEMGWEIFFQALVTIQNHPLLPHVKRLHIKQASFMFNALKMRSAASKFGELIGSLGHLDKLTIYGCDSRIFLANFLNNSGLSRLLQPLAFPQTKELKILYPSIGARAIEAACAETIVELAKSQHALGIPFERVTVRTFDPLPEMAERLRRWAAVVDCDVGRTCKEDGM